MAEPNQLADLAADPRYVTVRSAARIIGLKYHSLLRAVNEGLIPSYRPFNSRRLVRISDIEAVIAAHRVGGHDVAVSVTPSRPDQSGVR